MSGPDRNGVNVTLCAQRLLALAITGTALFIGLPTSPWSFLPALVAMFGWGGLIILAGYWMDRGRH